MILSQDGAQRTDNSNIWTFNWYDELGRLVVTGVKILNPTSHSSLIAIYENSLVTVSRNGDICGYTNSSSMPVNAWEVLRANYYNNYDWTTDAFLKKSLEVAPINSDTPYSSPTGLLTGTFHRVMGGYAQQLWESHYYDFKGNVVESHSKNMLSGYDHEFCQYRFSNELKNRYVEHCNSSNQRLLLEEYAYEHDHAGRMKKKWYSLNGAAPTVMASYRYNSLGQLSKKYTAGVENTEYNYNIRGWMTGINGLKFSETLSYTNQYGGNIASINWNDNINGTQGYSFSYDNLGRMKQATYNGASNRNYSESFTYDRNGNPLTTSRYGRVSDGAGNFSFGQIDALMYYYNGNQLTYIAESLANQYESDLMEVKRRLGSNEHYTYNANGNLTKDFNKNISSIQYNYLNLPNTLTFEDGKSISYVYDVSGVKHEVKHYNPYQNPVLQTTNYIGNKIYENNVLSKVLTEEGYLEKQGNIYQAYYYVKDHLGNNRLVLNEAGNVVQLTNYYPFGASFAELQPRNDQEKQYYKYNGKELDKSHGLNMYDYGARMYDPVIGRFSTMDPLAEKYYSVSPYAYCANNPINRIDPDGKDWTDFVNGVIEGAKQKVEDYTNLVVHPIETAKNLLTQPAPSIGQVIINAADNALMGAVSNSINAVSAIAADLNGGNGSATGKYIGGTAVDVGVAVATAKAGKVLGKGTSALSNEAKTFSKYDNVTKASRGKEGMPNIQTDATKKEVMKNLKAEGYKSKVKEGGSILEYSKGNRTYVIRDASKSSSGITMDVKKPGTSETIKKIRLSEN